MDRRQQQHIQLAPTCRGDVPPPMQPQQHAAGASSTSMCSFLHLAVYKGLMVEVMAQLPEKHAIHSRATGDDSSYINLLFLIRSLYY
jgi:hypothetical protein